MKPGKDEEVVLNTDPDDGSERFRTTTNGFQSTKSGACDVLFGSTDGSGVTQSLDGASNGDGGKIQEVEEVEFDRHTYKKYKTGRMLSLIHI